MGQIRCLLGFHTLADISSILFLSRVLLIGKTQGLLQLYLQPALQGYPPFADFAALYNASSTLSNLVGRDIMPFMGQIEVALGNIMNHTDDYLEIMAVFAKQFGNVQADGYQKIEIQTIQTITGKHL